MVNPLRDINWRPDRAARRRFGRSLMIGFPIVAVALAAGTRLSTGAWPLWPWWVGGGGAAVGLFCRLLPAAALPFYLTWYALAASIGLVVSNVVLAGSYYLTVAPIGLIMRACGRDPMRRRFDRSASTYWRAVETPTDPASYFRQF